MKNYFAVLIILFLQISLINVKAQEALFERIESLSAQEKLEQKEQAIKTIFKLPLEISFITGTIMQDINDFKASNCPNYPVEIGVGRLELKDNLINWITNYPEEYMSYIRKLHEEINKYTNS